MSAQRAPGPWIVNAPGTRQTTFHVVRSRPDIRPGEVEFMCNANGRSKRFKSREAAHAAIVKAVSASS